MKLLDFLRDITSKGFYGELTIKYRDGVPVLLTKHEQIKVDDEQQLGTSRTSRRCHDTNEGEHEQRDGRRQEVQY